MSIHIISPENILSEHQYHSCRLCPRQCGIDRSSHTGYCQSGIHPKVARAALHMWEEPCISGIMVDGEPADRQRGSGTVFFSGCTLGCCFCQNYRISHENFGKEITVRELADIFLRLQDQGAYNINLVTASHFFPSVVQALDLIRGQLSIPVVYNCGGYERPEIIAALANYVDIWLPDLKYFDAGLSRRYSQAPDYFTYASEAITQMIAQTGSPCFDHNGIMQSGVIVRHMVLPGARQDSIRLLHWMKEHLPANGYYLSLMSQYTPYSTLSSSKYPELARRITTYEYESILNTALELGLDTGYMQKKSSAKEEYTPPFNLEGL